MRMPRREFLKALGAGSTIAAIPGCATMDGARAKVVVVGGGYGARRPPSTSGCGAKGEST
jgi:hypothetical protein